MSAKIYYLKDETVQAMKEMQYEKEAELQEIVAKHPELLQRENENGQPRQLYLVQREQFTQAEEDQGNSFSLDHLMVDEDGVPVLVEVKRATDTRTRREVVAQMLDYACRMSSLDINQVKDSFGNNNTSTEIDITPDFWEKVKSNLKAEHFKMVFVADEIPDTLRILIDFMDRSMKDIEIYGVEIKRYQTKDAGMLATNIIGNISKTSNVTTVQRHWSAQEFDGFLRENGMSDVVIQLENTRGFVKSQNQLSVEMGTGKTFPSQRIKYKGKFFFSVGTWQYSDSHYECRIEIPVLDLPEFLSEQWDLEKLKELLVSLPHPTDAAGYSYIKQGSKWVYINLRAFAIPENWEYFKNTISMLLEEMSKN